MLLVLFSGFFLLTSSAPANDESSVSSENEDGGSGDSSVSVKSMPILICLSETRMTDKFQIYLLFTQRSDDTKENINTGTDLLKIGVGILNGFLGLLQVKIGIIRSLGSLLINTVMD